MANGVIDKELVKRHLEWYRKYLSNLTQELIEGVNPKTSKRTITLVGYKEKIFDLVKSLDLTISEKNKIQSANLVSLTLLLEPYSLKVKKTNHYISDSITSFTKEDKLKISEFFNTIFRTYNIDAERVLIETFPGPAYLSPNPKFERLVNGQCQISFQLRDTRRDPDIITNEIEKVTDEINFLELELQEHDLYYNYD